MNAFERCDFLFGEGNSILIVIPVTLPDAETYTVALTRDHMKFMAGYHDVAEMDYKEEEVYNRITNQTQVGLVEYPPEEEDFPHNITKVAYVEIRRSM